MYCKWQLTKLGGYIIGERIVGLDYNNLYLNPDQTTLTMYHEMIHAALNKTTEFGVATDDIYRLLNQMSKIKKEDRKRIKNCLYFNQIFVQEGTATLIEILHLKRKYGKIFAIDWANKNLPQDYLNKFKKLEFVLEFSIKYQDYFTSRIPHVAMQTDIRKQIIKQNLLPDTDKFIKFIEDENNNPDKRFEKLIESIKYNGAISKKSDQEICDITNIKFHTIPSKKEVSNFLNYIVSFTDIKNVVVKESDISDALIGTEALSDIGSNLIIANMNIDLVKNGMVEWELNNFLHYKDKIEAVVVSKPDLEEETKDFIEKNLIKNKYDASILGFTKTGEKIMTAVDSSELSKALTGELKDKTLIVKWGLYYPGLETLKYFPKSREPNVVIYNTTNNLEDNFHDYFIKKNKAHYIRIQASPNHPFYTLILKDEIGILHIVNSFPKFIDSFISVNNSSLENHPLPDLIKRPNYFNDVISIWMGLPWKIDWYRTIIDGNNVYYR